MNLTFIIIFKILFVVWTVITALRQSFRWETRQKKFLHAIPSLVRSQPVCWVISMTRGQSYETIMSNNMMNVASGLCLFTSCWVITVSSWSWAASSLDRTGYFWLHHISASHRCCPGARTIELYRFLFEEICRSIFSVTVALQIKDKLSFVLGNFHLII